jgi:hypothetical protein
LASRKGSQVIAYPDSQVAAFLAVHRGFRRLHIASRARLDLNEAEDIFVPADRLNFLMMPCSALVPCNHYISASPQIEIRVFFAASAGALMSGAFAIAVGGDPVNRAKSKLREAAREHWSKLQAHTANSL